MRLLDRRSRRLAGLAAGTGVATAAASRAKGSMAGAKKDLLGAGGAVSRQDRGDAHKHRVQQRHAACARAAAVPRA